MPEQLLHNTKIPHAILRVPYFFDPSKHEECLADPDLLDHPSNSQRKKIAAATLRLVDQERKKEYKLTQGRCKSATLLQEWSENWEPTPQRIDHIIRRNPLTILRLARQLMRINNSERPQKTGDQSAFIAISALAAQCGKDVFETVSHLARAGYNVADASQLPPDAADYLEVYPPSDWLREGEKSTAMLDTELDITNMVDRIADECTLYPEVRFFKGQGSREIEIWTPPDILVIKNEVAKIPRCSENEMFLATLQPKYRSAAIINKAIELAGIESFWRRHKKGIPGKGMCIKKADLPALQQAITYLTQKQPGERSAKDMAEELHVSLPTLRNNISLDDAEKGRDILQIGLRKGKGRHAHNRVYPEEVFVRVQERIQILRAAGIPISPVIGASGRAMQVEMAAEAAIAAARQKAKRSPAT